MKFYFKKLRGFWLSLLLHGTVMAYGAVAFVQTPQYGVETGTGGVEVSLTAAAQEIVAEVSSVPTLESEPLTQPAVEEPEALTLPQHKVEEKKLAAEKPVEKKPDVQTAVHPEFKGDGSSATPGKDSTTFYSAGGALAEAAPYYLKNPAPYYPFEARQKGWSGVVLLRVQVDKSGRASAVELEQSSGHGILDESAIKTVKKWRFRPAQAGSLPVESQVRIPIRFELEKS